MHITEKLISSSDRNSKILLRHICKEKDQTESVGIIHIIHDINEDSKSYLKTAQHLAASGYHVYIHDHRGHGKSVNNPKQLGNFGEGYGWRYLVEDIKIVNDQFHDSHFDLPVIMIGQGHGAYMMLKYLTRYSDTVQGAVISGIGYPNMIKMKLAKAFANKKLKQASPDQRSYEVEKLCFNHSLSIHKKYKPILSKTISAKVRNMTKKEIAIKRAFITIDSCENYATGVINLFSQFKHQGDNIDVPLLVLDKVDPKTKKSNRSLIKLYKALKAYTIGGVHNILVDHDVHDIPSMGERSQVRKQLLSWAHTTVISPHLTNISNRVDFDKQKLAGFLSKRM